MMDRVIGLIGAGAIGGTVLRACAEHTIECCRVVVFARHRRPDLEEQVRRIGGTVVGDLEGLVMERPSVVLGGRT